MQTHGLDRLVRYGRFLSVAILHAFWNCNRQADGKARLIGPTSSEANARAKGRLHPNCNLLASTVGTCICMTLAHSSFDTSTGHSATCRAEPL